jgi:hypothetical protein
MLFSSSRFFPFPAVGASAASRAAAGAAARLPLPEQVYDRKRDERREHETNEDRRQIHSRRTFLKNSAASIAGRTGRVKENKTG